MHSRRAIVRGRRSSTGDVRRSAPAPLLRWLRPVVLGALVAGLGACAETNYVYQPADRANALEYGYPAASYPIPPQAPQGVVRLASFGVTEIEAQDTVPVVHVRLIVANDSGPTNWSVDTREIELDMRGQGTSRAAFVNSNQGGLPVVTIPPAQQRVIDFYYPLPQGMDEPEDVPAFDVIWRVHTDAAVFVQRTPFQRLEVAEPPPPPTIWHAGFVVGYGAYWYYDPFWPRYTFVRPHVVVVGPRYYGPHYYRSHRVYIRSSPSWHRRR